MTAKHKSTAIIAAFACGVMLSPDALVFLGNAFGSLRYPAAIAFGLYTLLMASTLAARRHLAESTNEPQGQMALLSACCGHLPAATILLGARIGLTVFLSTGVLVTAGFVLNEVFIYWFPNFLFAYLILGFIWILNLKPKLSRACQPVFAGAALVGILLLIAIGAFGGGKALSQFNGAPSVVSRFWFYPLFVVVGFELALDGQATQDRTHSGQLGPIMAALVGAAVLLLLWGLVSLYHVPAGKLAETGIPHMIAARTIAGQTGRVIMGIVLIAGTCAAVNALIHGTTAMLLEMRPITANQRSGRHYFLILACLVAGPALMMGIGLAGYTQLEAYIRGALLLWVAQYGLLHAGVLRRRHVADASVAMPAGQAVLSGLVFLLILAGIIVLVLTEPLKADLFQFLLSALVTGFVLSLIWLRLQRPADR